MDKVDFSPILRNIIKFPVHIISKLRQWARWVEEVGLEETRKIPGFHDEALKGNRKGQRSIRLSRGYRAIYTVHPEDKNRIILIEEVSKHDY